MIYSRRKMFFALGALICTSATFLFASTNGFGLLPHEYDDNPVFVEDGFAIRGYDPVAYFTHGEPRAGRSEHQLNWNGATWLFENNLHKEMFAANPAQYAPQYGGFCAWAISEKGKLYSTQASNWKIVDGKLYLNFNDAIQEKWEQDISGHIKSADKRWPRLSGDSRG